MAAEVRFRVPRDVFVGVNELLIDHDLAVLELETWTDAEAFLLVRQPQWDKLRGSDLVVVKAEKTADDGECADCASTVGTHWRSCIVCGAERG